MIVLTLNSSTLLIFTWFDFTRIQWSQSRRWYDLILLEVRWRVKSSGFAHPWIPPGFKWVHTRIVYLAVHTYFPSVVDVVWWTCCYRVELCTVIEKLGAFICISYEAAGQSSLWKKLNCEIYVNNFWSWFWWIAGRVGEGGVGPTGSSRWKWSHSCIRH